MRPAQAQVVEGDVEEISGATQDNPKRLLRPLPHLPAPLAEPPRLLRGRGEAVQSGPVLRLPTAQQQVAISIARQRKEPGVLGLPLRLHSLGLAEGLRALLPPARLV